MNRIIVLIALVFRWREAFPRLVRRALFPPLQLVALADGFSNLQDNIILGNIPMQNTSAVRERFITEHKRLRRGLSSISFKQVTFKPVAVPGTITGAERWK
jgi:hypothetical protein